MTLALYRKYRPRTFSEIIGQEHVTEPLSQALRSGNINHAYLFSGPRGCGKTSSARILARSLNCEKGPTPDPCGECDSCRALAPDGAGSIDVIEIDAASHGGVDDARDLRERAFFAPVSSRYKIYVIDEAHMVSSAGFNALLKLVEEPPEYVKFVFATTEPEKVLGTIKSRTHHYPFRLIPPGVLRPYLEQLATAEGVHVEPAVFPLVVRAGGGSARDSLSVLDQLIAGAGDAGVTYARAVALLGVTDAALIDEVCDALAAGDGAAVYSTINRVAEAGHDARRFAGDLLERLRNLIVLQQVPDAIDKGLLDGADDELARMRVQSQQFGAATLSRMADIVHTGLIDMRGTAAPRLVLELIAARMLLPGADDSTSALLARMELMERRLAYADPDNPQTAAVRPTVASVEPGPGAGQLTGAAAARAAIGAASRAEPLDHSTSANTEAAIDVPSGVVVPPPPTRSRPAAEPVVPSPAAAPEAGVEVSGAPARAAAAPNKADVNRVLEAWPEVLSIVKRKKPRIHAMAVDATVREINGDVLLLSFQYPFHAEGLAASPEVVQEALYEVLDVRWRISCEVAGQSSASADRRMTPPTVPPPVLTEPVGSDAPSSGPGGGAASTPHATASAAASDVARRSAAPASGRGAVNARGGSGIVGPPGSPGPGGVVVASSASAVPRGGVATATRSDAPTQSAPPVEEDWPTTATLGGAGADGGIPPEPAADAAKDARPQSNTASAAVDRAAARATTAPSSARGSTRPASTRTTAGQGPASAGNGRPGAAGRTGAGGPGVTVRKAADDTWAGAGDEPPWDPEFDGPVGAPSQHVGFDPGDEPMDDETDVTTRPTTEQQALDLLREALGAEKISD